LIFRLAHNGSRPSPESELKDGTSILQDTNMLKARRLQHILKDERLFSKILLKSTEQLKMSYL